MLKPYEETPNPNGVLNNLKKYYCGVTSDLSLQRNRLYAMYVYFHMFAVRANHKHISFPLYKHDRISKTTANTHSKISNHLKKQT